MADDGQTEIEVKKAFVEAGENIVARGVADADLATEKPKAIEASQQFNDAVENTGEPLDTETEATADDTASITAHFEEISKKGDETLLLLQNLDGNFLEGLMQLLEMLFGGNVGGFNSMLQDMKAAGFGSEENEVLEKVGNLSSKIGNWNNTELVQEVKDIFDNTPILKDTEISPLLEMIVATESSGGDPNVIYDYTGGTGLHPGDVTYGGLEVPDITKSTVNEVIAWQRQYLDEQYSVGGKERGTGSSAAGALQFTMTTLKEMRDSGYINGNTIFSPQAQIELGVKRMIQMRGFGDLFKDKISDQRITEIARGIQSEWEGAKKNITLGVLKETLKEIRQEVIESDQAHKFTSNDGKDFTLGASV